MDLKITVREYLAGLYSSGLSQASLDNLECVKCKTAENVEMHHVRKLSSLNPKLSELDRIMAKRNRKQIPLCRVCHQVHHKTQSP